MAKATVRGGFFLFLGMTSSTIILALTSILVARLLGPENYGLYSVILIVPSFLIALSDLGVSHALTRFSAHFHVQGKRQKSSKFNSSWNPVQNHLLSNNLTVSSLLRRNCKIYRASTGHWSSHPYLLPLLDRPSDP